MKARIIFLLLLAITFICTSPGLAQSDRGIITGTVTDQQSAVVPNAKVTAIQGGTNVARSTLTSATGVYTLAQLPVGTYRIEIEATGFKKLVRAEIVVNASTSVRVDAALELGAVTETVSVVAAAPLLQADNAKVTTAVTNKFVQELPLVVAGEARSPLDLALITPEAKAVGADINLGGGQEAGYDVTLDGVNATPNQAAIIYRQISTLNSPSVDAITEFSVDTNGFKAESGRAG